MSDNIVHVVDDDEAARESLEFLLDCAGLTVRTYGSAAELLARLDDLEGGCIVTDIRMPQMTGLELIERLREEGISLPVIVITGHADVPLAIRAMKQGVADFIEKPFDETIVASIQAALEREEGVDRLRTEQDQIAARIESLSPREKDVLDGLVEGLPNKSIAYDLGISPRTVEVYRANVMTKMKAGSLSELVRMVTIAELRR